MRKERHNHTAKIKVSIIKQSPFGTKECLPDPTIADALWHGLVSISYNLSLTENQSMRIKI